VALSVEDWLLIRVAPSLIRELPERIDTLKQSRLLISYSDATDALTYRFEEEQPAYYERFADNVYLERSWSGTGIIVSRSRAIRRREPRLWPNYFRP
jgi:hypothetical protein